ncbi:MAG TPA: hypothetical protein PLW44_04205 [Chitinophagales bacterium]|nr:hypothetical protein [Chitinophagales bacterium]
MELSDIIGFTGVSILLVAYVLDLFNVTLHYRKTHLLLNLLGAGLACLASVMINYMPFVILEGTWALVSLVTLIGVLVNKNKLPV